MVSIAFERTHAETLNGSRSRQRTKTLDFCSPKTGYGQTERGQEIHGSFPDLDSQCIAEQTAGGDSNNARPIATYVRKHQLPSTSCHNSAHPV
jgi:hypothetical protein